MSDDPNSLAAGILARYTNSIAAGLAQQIDAQIKAALDHQLGTWGMDDVRKRCKIVVCSRVQTFFIDETPMLELDPIEFHQDTDVMRCTRKYRRLYV